MGTRKRTAGRLQVEALEARWTPGGMSGGVLGDRMTCGSKPGVGSGSN